jgi:hypothetical protein
VSNALFIDANIVRLVVFNPAATSGDELKSSAENERFNRLIIVIIRI